MEWSWRNYKTQIINSKYVSKNNYGHVHEETCKKCKKYVATSRLLYKYGRREWYKCVQERYIYCPAVQIEESNLSLAIEDYIFLCSSV